MPKNALSQKERTILEILSDVKHFPERFPQPVKYEWRRIRGDSVSDDELGYLAAEAIPGFTHGDFETAIRELLRAGLINCKQEFGFHMFRIGKGPQDEMSAVGDVRWLSIMPDGEAALKPSKKTPKKRRPTRPKKAVDLNRVWDLRSKGWTHEQIGHELGFTRQYAGKLLEQAEKNFGKTARSVRATQTLPTGSRGEVNISADS